MKREQKFEWTRLLSNFEDSGVPTIAPHLGSENTSSLATINAPKISQGKWGTLTIQTRTTTTTTRTRTRTRTRTTRRRRRRRRRPPPPPPPQQQQQQQLGPSNFAVAVGGMAVAVIPLDGWREVGIPSVLTSVHTWYSSSGCKPCYFAWIFGCIDCEENPLLMYTIKSHHTARHKSPPCLTEKVQEVNHKSLQTAIF